MSLRLDLTSCDFQFAIHDLCRTHSHKINSHIMKLFPKLRWNETGQIISIALFIFSLEMTMNFFANIHISKIHAALDYVQLKKLSLSFSLSATLNQSSIANFMTKITTIFFSYNKHFGCKLLQMCVQVQWQLICHH